MPETVMTGESIAALICVPLLIVGLLVLGYWLLGKVALLEDSFEAKCAACAALACGAGAVIAAVGLWWGMYPWKWEYHEWRPIAGTVKTVDFRLMGNQSGGMEDKFVVTFEGNPQQYGVLDTRAASLRPGDDLTIACVRRWQWSGTHGYDCNFVSMAKH